MVRFWEKIKGNINKLTDVWLTFNIHATIFQEIDDSKDHSQLNKNTVSQFLSNLYYSSSP